MIASCARRVAALFAALLFPLSAAAATQNFDFRVLIDTDNDATTGCTVATATGLFKGVEQVLITRVSANATTGTVTGVTRQICTDPIANAFSAELPVDGGGWPITMTPGGSMLVETHIPNAVVGSSPRYRLNFTVTSGTQTDDVASLHDGSSTTTVVYPAPLPPHHRAAGKATDRIITLDGAMNDWDGLAPVATGTSASSPSLRLLNTWAFMGNTDFYFAFAAQSNSAAPTAYDDNYSVVTGGTLGIAVPGVLTNDTDPNHKPLTASLIAGPANGTLTLNADGSFSYTNNGGVAPIDHFQYKANNGTLDSNTALVTIDITSGSEDAPEFTSPPSTTFTVGQIGNFTVTTDGHPTATVTMTGHLPAGVNFTAAPGGGTLHGNPAVGTGGVYHLVFTATNVRGSATQNFTLTVREAPAILSANATTFITSTPGTFTVTTRGYPFPSITEAGALPAGVTLTDNHDGTATLQGTPGAATGGTYPLTLTATNSVGTANQSFTLTVKQPPVFTSTNTLHVIAGTPVNFTVSATGYPLPAINESGALPTGLSYLDHGNGTGTISGTPTQGSGGSYPITFTATSTSGTATQPFTITACNVINVANPATNTATANAAFSQNFTQTFAVGTATFTTASPLPSGLTLASNGTLSGTPLVVGSFPIVVTVTDSLGCSNSGPTYTLTVSCQTITVTNPATTTGTANTAFSQTFTAGNTIGAVSFTLQSGSLPSGLTLASNGTLSGTPMVVGSFPITVKATDANGCFGVSGTYNLSIGCQTIGVTNPATTTGTVSSPFSQTFTASNTIGAVSFSTASALPTGLSLSTAGVLSGTPTQTGSFPIVVTATDGNGCSGNGATYTLVINCQTITVTDPSVSTATAGSPFSQSFSQTGAIGTATFTTASTLPVGVTLSSAGLLAGTPTQTGSFPIVVTVTDSNNCTGTGATYTLIVGCPTITVTNPSTNTATVGTAFSQNFTQSGAVGGATFTTASTLPTGITLATNGTLSGTPTQSGIFTIVVTVTDGNNCTGTGNTYTLTVSCQTIIVTNPATTTGTANAAFSQTFTQSGALAGATFTTASTLPNGLTLSTGGVLSGTPTQIGTFPIVVTVTDGHNCSGTGSTYSLVISCQTITVTNPVTNTGVANSAFSQTFTAGNTIGAVTFTLNSGSLPSGLTLATNGTLSGTPLVVGSFPITVRATDANGCFGVGSTYTINISCQTISVTNPSTTSGTAAAAFSQTFTASNTIGAVSFTTASTLPTGLSLSTAGVLSGTPTQTGSFPIVVTATDANLCQGSGATYTLVINCQTITVTDPSVSTATAGSPFSQSFSQSGAIGTATFSTASTLPVGVTLSSAGLLAGTPTQTGTFPIDVTVTDSNLCTGNGATYTLIVGCPTITVTNPSTNTATVGTAFSQNFTQSGAVGGATFTSASTLPNGLSLSTAGVLSGTPTQSGVFPIDVTVTDGNNCTGSNTTYTLTVNCQTITVTNPATTTGTANAAFSQTFTQSGALAGATFSTASTLPNGLSLSSGGVLSGTPTQVGSFDIVVTVTDGHNCTGTGSTYTLVISCQTITVTNPASGAAVANSAFSQTFTAGNTIGAVIFSLETGPLPSGLTLASNGTLSGTPLVVGSFPITVRATDANGCFGIGSTYTINISCQTISVTNPAVTTGTAASAFSQTFTAGNTIGTVAFTTASTLPNGLTLASNGTLSGTPTQTGSFDIVVTATDANGCQGTGSTYTLVISCQVITVTAPANTNGTVSAPFSEQFSQTGAIGTATFTTASTLPTGLTLSSSGLLSGTPLQAGPYSIVVVVTDSNSCTGQVTYNLNIACQVITVSNPSSNSDPAGTPLVAANFTFTQSGAVGGATFTTSSGLPNGVTLTSAGVLTGTPSQGGTFPISVVVTDGNGCTGTNPSYTLTITCPVITVTNPGVSSGTAGVAFSQTFTQSGGLGTITWSKSGDALPSGITLNSATGVLSGTTHAVGTFNITVTATDQNGCQGSGALYTLSIGCQTIGITNPVVNTGTVDAAFSQTFTASGILDTATWSITSGTLPAGLTFHSGTGVLDGTPTAPGTAPLTIKVQDTNGCFTTSSYTLTINCQTITVTKPLVTTGTVDTFFSQTFTQTGAHGGASFSTVSTLPAGMIFHNTGTLDGTPTAPLTTDIVVTATDVNGCTGTSATYHLVIGCQAISVTNPSTTTGTVNAVFSQLFTQSGGHGATTFSTSSTLPNGITLSSGGMLSGTPTQPGNFPIVVRATDANGCFGDGSTYTLVISCQTITVTNPVNTSGTVASGFSEQFQQSGGFGTTTFSTTSTLPVGLSLSSSGLLSGTPTQSGTFPIVVKATDSNLCFGTGSTYNLVIACNVVTVNNPATNTGTAGVAFTATFTQSGGNGTITWSKTGSLPAGISLNSSTGVLSGTTNSVGTFPLTVTATDGNSCSGSNSYTLTINCQTITVTNPGVTQGTAGVAFSQTFTKSGILGTVTWSESGALPTGITLNSSTGVLSGTTTQVGSFPIVVKATDTNLCFGTSNYTLTIICQTITVTNPATTQGTAGVAFSQTFTSSGILGTPTWSESGTLPTGLTLNTATGVLSGTPTQTGSFPITVTVTDSNTCSGSGASYALNIICPTITVGRTGGGTFPQGTYNVAYSSQSATASGSNGTPYNFTISLGALPTGLSMSTAGAISGTPTATGTFSFTIKATDAYGCSGTFPTTIAIKPNLGNDSYSNLVNNTQEYITGGTTATPATPATFHSTKYTANDSPAGLLLSAGTCTAGGTLTLAQDGTFLYTPPVANLGLAGDVCTYNASSDTGATGTPVSASATITFNFANRVWYINPTAAVNGDGRSNTPFNTTTSVPVSPTLANNDIIFIYNNSGTTTNTKKKIDLSGASTLTGVQLIGQGVSLVVNTFTLVSGSAASAPTLTATTPSADVVWVGSGDTINGVILTNGANSMIANASTVAAPAGLTVSNVTMTPSGTANGINLSGATGTVTIGTTTFTGTSSGDIIKANTGTAQWNFTSSPMTQTAGRALNVTNKTGGGMSFDAASTITVSAGTTDGAITLTSNTGSETFALPKIVITATGTARGMVLTNTGTVNNTTDLTNSSTISTADTATLCGAGNCTAAIDASGSVATGTALGLTFKSINVNGTNGHVPVGIRLQLTTGSFRVLGDGTDHANGSGGSISNILGGVAGNSPIYALTVAGTLSFSSMNFSINTNGYSGPIFDNNATSTVTVNVKGCTFTGVTTSVVQQKALLQFEGGNSSNVTANVQNCYFNGSRTYGVASVDAGAATMNTTINQCGFGTDVNSGAPINQPGTTITNGPNLAILVSSNSSAPHSYAITNNTVWGLKGNPWAVSVSGSSTAGGDMVGSVVGNKIGKTGVVGSGCSPGCGGIGLLPGLASLFEPTVTGNDVRQVNSDGIGLVNNIGAGAAGTIKAKIKGNTIAEPDTTGAPTFQRGLVISPGNSGGANNASCVEIGDVFGGTVGDKNTISGTWQSSGTPTTIRVTNNNNSSVMTMPGLATGSQTAATIQTFLEAHNVVAAGSTAVTTGASGINGTPSSCY